MFKEILQKVNELEHHYQAFFALVVAIAVVMFSWGFEKLLEEYVFPKKPLFGYLFAVFFGILLLVCLKFVLLDLV